MNVDKNAADSGASLSNVGLGGGWKREPPTAPGYYWMRYVDMNGKKKEPDIIWLVEPGRAFEFGSEHTFEPGAGCFEYGPKIEPPNI